MSTIEPVPRPFLKWAGGKRRILGDVLRAIPPDPAAPWTYYEPFLGGGALFFALHRAGRIRRAILGDCNPWLLTAYRGLRVDPGATMAALDALAEAHAADPAVAYAGAVAELNAEDSVRRIPCPDPSLAALVLYVNRACFNGLWRVNRAGKFNTPIGTHPPGKSFYDAPNLAACAEALRGEVRLACADFESTLRHRPAPGDLVYLDPPYDSDAGFVGYAAGGFDRAAQERLAAVAADLAASGVRVVASNADTAFVRESWGDRGFVLHELEAPRSISRDGASRRPAREVLLVSPGAPAGNVVAMATPSSPSPLPTPEVPVSSDPALPSNPATPPNPAPARRTARSAAPRHVVRVVAPRLQGGVDVALGLRTLLVGPTESGKDAVLRALELALAGVARDVAFRDTVAKPGDLIALAAGRRGELKSEVVLSDGATGSWSTSGGDGRAREPDWRTPPGVDPDLVFPVRALLDAVRGNPDTARRFVIRAACGAISGEDVSRRIPAPLHGAFTRARALAGGSAHNGAGPRDPLADLLAAAEAAGKEARRAAQEAKAARAVVEGVTALPAMPTAAQVVSARAAVESARTIVEAAASAEASRRHDAMSEATRVRLADAEARLRDAEARHEAAREGLGTRPPTTGADRLGRAAALLQVLDRQVAVGAHECVVCASPVDPGRLDARAREIRAAAEALHAALAAEVAAQRAWDTRAREAEARAEAAALVRREVEILRTTTGGAADSSAPLDLGAGSAPDPAEARAALARAEEALRACLVAEAQWKVVDESRARAAASEREAGEWGQLADACRDATRELLDASIEAFCARVQSYLPGPQVFDLRVREGDRDVFQVGLVRDAEGHPVPRGTPGAVLHTALSGSAGLRVLLAVACAMVPAGQFAVVVPPDRGRDPVELRAHMVALSSSPCQVILQSTVRPAGRMPPGWTVVELENGPAADASRVQPAGTGTRTEIGAGSAPADEIPADEELLAAGGEGLELA